MILHTPIAIGKLQLKNRLVLPPMATWKASETGEIPQELADYYRERSGKIGLITLEFAYVSEEGKARAGQLSIAKDSDIPQIRKLTDAIHSQGATKVFAQINHAGTAAGYTVQGQEDIDRIIAAFADAALRAKDAGCDGVEIHAAHGYLLTQFFSPLSNHRTDGYGPQTVESRARLTIETIRAVRKAVGPDYPVGVRFGGCDYQEGGSTIADAVLAAPLYQAAGADMLSITGGMNGYRIPQVTTPGWFSDLSKAVKDAVTIPVLLTGGITTPQQAEDLLTRQTTDLIGVGRPFLQDAGLIEGYTAQMRRYDDQ